MHTSLAFRTAEQRVGNFADESDWFRLHEQAMECRDCEDVLRIGIEAFEWLNRADETVRGDVIRGLVSHDPQDDQRLGSLFRRWLASCEKVNHWIHQLQSRGFEVENVEDFCRCETEARAMVAYLDDDSPAGVLPDRMSDLRDEAIREYDDGETAGFVSDD